MFRYPEREKNEDEYSLGMQSLWLAAKHERR